MNINFWMNPDAIMEKLDEGMGRSQADLGF